jgi:hypothetical protein
MSLYKTDHRCSSAASSVGVDFCVGSTVYAYRKRRVGHSCMGVCSVVLTTVDVPHWRVI